MYTGIGGGQIEVLKDRIERRRAVYEQYHAKMKGIVSVRFVDE